MHKRLEQTFIRDLEGPCSAGCVDRTAMCGAASLQPPYLNSGGGHGNAVWEAGAARPWGL